MNAQSKSILFIVFLTIISIRLFANDIGREEFVKEISKEFATTQDGEVNIFNKYGTVDIKSWEQNRVKIEVKIIVNASNSKDADAVFNRINVNFIGRAGYVSAETVIGSKKETTRYKRWIGSWAESSDDFKIHFVVYMPKTNSLTLKTKYCDNSLDYLSSKGDLQVKYGNFDSEGFGGDVTMALSYGNGKIEKLRDLAGNLSYGELTLVACNNVDLGSKYSDIKIVTAQNLDITSKYDDYNIGVIKGMKVIGRYSDFDIEQIEDLTYEGKYADLRIDLLINNADLTCQYSDVIIKNLENGFGVIEYNGKHSDIRIGTKLAKSFCIDANEKYGEVDVPPKAIIIQNNKSSHGSSVTAYLTTHYCSSKIRGVVNYGKIVIVR